MERDASELFQKGMEMMQLGEYQMAEQLFKKARDITMRAPGTIN